MDSIWSQSVSLPRFPALTGDHKTDVLIIGGGLAGILCSYMLSQSGVEHLLVEAKRICSGITKDTTAKITSQHGLLCHKLTQKFGIDAARLYYRANQEALERYRALCQTISCDFSERDAYVYSRNDRRKIDQELEALAAISFPAQLADGIPLPFPTAGAVRFSRQAQFHPLKFVSAITQGLPIYENTKVLELKPGKAVTRTGAISAEKIIIATHFPFLNKHGSYFLKMYQHRSYVLALKNAQDVDGMYVDEAEKGLSFRNHDGLLLLGGGSHRTGKKGGNWRELLDFAARSYPEAQETGRWATQDCMTLDGAPYIGQYSRRTPGLYVATGFNKWGMSSAMVAAALLTDLVQNRENPYTEVFSPSRSILRPQLAINAAEAVFNLLTPTVPRCPHMGCALKYNAQEHSWDCPCHGSRFTDSGKLINNPATDDRKR